MLTRSLFNFRPHIRLFSAAVAHVKPITGLEAVKPPNKENKENYDKNGSVLRSGALAIKKGMMSYWDSWGKRHPVTILHVTYLENMMII